MLGSLGMLGWLGLRLSGLRVGIKKGVVRVSVRSIACTISGLVDGLSFVCPI